MNGPSFYLRDNKAQVFVVSLWVLMILTILALNIGHRVSFALRVTGYYKDRFKSRLLAKAAVNRGVYELLSDKTIDYDAMTDSWADNESVFKAIVVGEDPKAYGSVSYVTGDDTQNETRYGIVDEERKVNINTASKEVLTVLLEKIGVDTPQDAAQNILIWRGDAPDPDNVYATLGYHPKSAKIERIEELVLIPGLELKDYYALQEWATVYGNGLLNINTASADTLGLFARGIARQNSISDAVADALVTKIIESRQRNEYFKDSGDIDIILVEDDETNLYNELMGQVTFKSNYFLIEASGHANKIKTRSAVVYDRDKRKIVYEHEG